MLFKNIIGQTKLKSRFIQEINEGHIPHAILLCGQAGYGTLPLALAYAQYLCCEHPREDDACGQCPSCIKWHKYVHPDAHFTFPVTKNTKKKKELSADYLEEWREMLIQKPYFNIGDWLDKIDAENSQAIIYAKESDELYKNLSLKSLEGGYKISIIWLPERMHEVFANKILKMLEEPTPQTLFLLISETPDKLLPTIQSRVQKIIVPRIEEDAVEEYLENELHINNPTSKRIAHIAAGDLIKATNILTVDNENAEYLELFIKLMRLAYKRDVKEMKEWADNVAALGREKQKNFFTYCQHMVRENFIYNIRCKEMNYMTEREEQFSKKFSPFINEQNIIAMMDELSLAEKHIEQNVNAKMVCFDFALNMIVLIKH